MLPIGMGSVAPTPSNFAAMAHKRMSPVPKIIHYIWFGSKPKPEGMLAAIEDWRKLMPGYELREWNESNIDMAGHPWMKRMYDQKRYAFASDYARFQILWEH